MLLYHKYESISVFIFGYLAYFLLLNSIYNAIRNIVGFKVLPSLGDYYIYLKVEGLSWLSVAETPSFQHRGFGFNPWSGK